MLFSASSCFATNFWVCVLVFPPRYTSFRHLNVLVQPIHGLGLLRIEIATVKPNFLAAKIEITRLHTNDEVTTFAAK